MRGKQFSTLASSPLPPPASDRPARDPQRRQLLRRQLLRPHSLRRTCALLSVGLLALAVPAGPSLAQEGPGEQIRRKPIRASRPYRVTIGRAANRSRFRDADFMALFRAEVTKRLTEVDRVVLQDGRRSRRRSHLRLDPNLNELNVRIRGDKVEVRCEVALLLMDARGGSIRAVMNGSATGTSAAGSDAERTQQDLAKGVLVAAVRSAMRGAAPTIARAARLTRPAMFAR